MKTILIQIDTGNLPSAFDSIVAVDCGVDQLLRFGEVDELTVTEVVHGALFTRGAEHLNHTAIFVGGPDVELCEKLLKRIEATFFGPFRVSTMLDPNGANTTAVAAVRCIEREIQLKPGIVAWVPGGTGPVGQRVCRLLARHGIDVILSSRTLARATRTAKAIVESLPNTARVHPAEFNPGEPTKERLNEVDVVVSAGAAGVETISNSPDSDTRLKVAVDLNAVPPAGIRWIQPTDRAKRRDNVVCYGAIGVGGLKMKLHKFAIRSLFESNEQILDVDQLYALSAELEI